MNKAPGCILALDLAAKYGWAIIDKTGRYVTSGHDKLTGGYLGRRMNQLYAELARLTAEYGPDWIATEAPIQRTGFLTARALYAYSGVAQMVADDAHIGYAEFSRTDYCKAILGTGHADKATGVLHARQFKPLLNSDDEADAILVGLCAHARRGHRP